MGRGGGREIGVRVGIDWEREEVTALFLTGWSVGRHGFLEFKSQWPGEGVRGEELTTNNTHAEQHTRPTRSQKCEASNL